jgi:hypothetical protein
MTLSALIDERQHSERAFTAALHDKQLRSHGGDDGQGLVRGRRLAHIERMKARRRGGGC